MTARKGDAKRRKLNRIAAIPYIPFDRDAPQPFYLQIYHGVRNAILSGRLVPGQRLPSSRMLALDLQISRIPVVIAFEHLIEEGYLEARRGSGTYVSEAMPEEITAPIRWHRLSAAATPAPPPPGAMQTTLGMGPFRVSMPALNHLPRDLLAQLLRRHSANVSTDLMMDGDPGGYLPLREALAAYLRTARAVDCDASQVLITSGSTMAMWISAMVLTTPDSIVVVEDPGYPQAKDALRASNAKVVPIPVDDEGIDMAAIRSLRTYARMIVVTPSHQYPLGTSMSIPRRIELTDWANRHDGWVLEDDYDSEFRYRGRPLSSLQGMDSSGHVIYVGSFSKVLFPALRIGYVVVPPNLVEAFTSARESVDIFPSILPQMMLADFVRDGHFTRHLRRMRSLYLGRRDALIRALRELAGDILTIGNTDAGSHLVVFLRPGIDDREVVRRAALRGMYPTALSTCYATTAVRQGLLLGFAGSAEAVLVEAVAALAQLIREMV